MEEKTIIKSERYDVKKVLYAFLILAVIAFVFVWFTMYNDTFWWAIERHNEKRCESHDSWYGSYYSQCDNFILFCALERCLFGEDLWWLWLLIPIGVALIGVLVFFLLKSMEIVVTDKRVHGRTYFGKRVDLPLDSVSSVGSAWLKGITVATSSGKISFLLIKNAREIHEEIRKLLIERQEKEKTAQPEKVSAATSVADELKNYKELLDSGIITQEEFDKKKKELLGF